MKSEECKVHGLVADVLVFAWGKILFVRHNDTQRYDGQKGWFLPDDFLNHGEHPAEAVRRILREQAGSESALIVGEGGHDYAYWSRIFRLTSTGRLRTGRS